MVKVNRDPILIIALVDVDFLLQELVVALPVRCSHTRYLSPIGSILHHGPFREVYDFSILSVKKKRGLFSFTINARRH